MTLPFTTKKIITTSAGADSASSIPALNASGLLDGSFLNSTVTGGTSTQAGMLAALTASGLLDVSLYQGITTGGTTDDAGKTPLLNADGILDDSFLPTVYSGGGTSKILTAFGWQFVLGSGLVPASSSTVFSLNVNFPSGTRFATAPVVLAAFGTHTATSVGTIPGVSIEDITTTGFTLWGDTDSDHIVINNVPFNYIAIGSATTSTT